jgi:23S rRNA pseudouridine1911/1915/1917 synthase
MDRDNYPDYIEKLIVLEIPAGQAMERLDIYITNNVAHATRNKVQMAIEQGLVTVNGCIKKTSYKVKPADIIQCRFLRPPPLQLIPENIPLDIFYEDEYLMVLNKPAGMVVHPGFGNRYGTLVNAVLWHTGYRQAIDITPQDDESGDSEAEEDLISESDILRNPQIRPGIVHRLDKDTSGLMVVSKDPMITPLLSSQFANRTVQREYIALAWGLVKQDQGIIEGLLDHSPRDRKVYAVSTRSGKFAKTEYWVLGRGQFATLLRLKLYTGRTHQIRVHCSSIHHPLIGDKAYGGDVLAFGGLHNPALRNAAQKCLDLLPYQALHARVLGFYHPVLQQQMYFECPPGTVFTQACQAASIEIPQLMQPIL